MNFEPSSEFGPSYKLFRDCNDGTGDVFGSVFYYTDKPIYFISHFNRYYRNYIRIDYRANYNGMNAEQLNSIDNSGQLKAIDVTYYQIYNFSFFYGWLPDALPDFSFDINTGEKTSPPEVGYSVDDNGFDTAKELLEYGAEYYNFGKYDDNDNAWQMFQVYIELSTDTPEWFDDSTPDDRGYHESEPGSFELRITNEQQMHRTEIPDGVTIGGWGHSQLK